jgi:alkylated DNA repair protein alkB homolog 8
VSARDALHTCCSELLGRKLYVQYAAVAPATPGSDNSGDSDVDCASIEAAAAVPGLSIIENFVTEDEEVQLLREFLQEGIWDTSISRRVRHYGHWFSYVQRGIDFAAQTPAIPACCEPLLQRIAAAHPHLQPSNQITLNEYAPGQGIAPHVDTHSAFDDGLLSLSLGSAVAMDFRHPDGVRRAAVWLPRRSLVTMTGDARYAWTHGIAGRKTDTAITAAAVAAMEGESSSSTSSSSTSGSSSSRTVHVRGTRVSLMLRSVRPAGAGCAGCSCPERCDTQQAKLLRSVSADDRSADILHIVCIPERSAPNSLC